ncbi:T9SS type B sorting domain-containing protein [Flavobacterium sp. TSSA_36]|uniref:T9SS type B sorting domain-containing protein n=1 Tax=Flavobacterium sp. TSSA_36 TaxID=3447669 RepID=UPI003F2BB431
MKKPTTISQFAWKFCTHFSSKIVSCFDTRNGGLSYSQKPSPTRHRFALTLLTLVLMTSFSYGQIGKAFSARLNDGNGNKYLKVKGDVVLIGNTVINKVGDGSDTNPAIFSPAPPVNGVAYTGTVTNLAALTTEANIPYTGPDNNNKFYVEYIDIDGDNNTFSSSTANLFINNSCKRIVFAGLYWSAIYPYDRSTDRKTKYDGSLRDANFDKIKFKVPNGNYQDIVADQIIFDGYKYNGPNVSDSFKDSPYVCFKDVTSIVTNLTDADGPYTVANVRAARGKRDGGGAGGWSLVVVYESPTVPSKFISIFDGYVGVNPDVNTPGYLPLVDFQVSGFKTLPSPLPVNAKIGVAALEGDAGNKGDTFQFKALSVPLLFTAISDAKNPADNFFNASITNNGLDVTNRVPNSTNTLGIDIDNVIVPNALNEVIPNGETDATLRLTTTGDGYGAFVTTFAVDIIEPTILLTKEVFDNTGADASNANVILGQQLNYVIGFENQGNDDATGFTIKDILPKNVDFNYPGDIDVASLPAGVTHSYNAGTRTLIFNIPDALVLKSLTPGGPFIRSEIRFKVKVKPDCDALVDRCDNVIKNSAYATYKGVVNPTQITDDPSISKFTSCNLGLPQPTNFLVGINDCIYSQKQVLCQASKTLAGPSGYASYAWSGPFGFAATTETVTVTQPGVYRVYAVGIAPCTDYKEDFTVTPFGGTVVNPIIAFADNKNPDGTITVCPNNGKELPKIFLCGLTGSKSSRTIATGITGATSIVWETTTCPPIPANLSDLCANEDTSCTWTSAGLNGPNFVANTAGQFRVTINYEGGCFNRFYFNVYQNTLNFDVTATDIICATPGKIIVNNVPSTGYEFSIDGTNYQASNIFDNITTQNAYTVYVRQTGIVGNVCVFEINNIPIRQRNFTVTANASQPLCYGDKGNVLVVANDVEPQYTFNIYPAGGTTPITTSGLQMGNQFTFGNLSPGSYDVEAITENQCSGKKRIVIDAPTQLAATVAITKPITCNDGELTVTAQGGTAPYNYSINGQPFVTSNVFAIPSPGGTFSIRVVDKNNCVYTIPDKAISANPKPEFSVAKTDILCYGTNSGTITFSVTNPNGYTLAFSKDNGATFVPNGSFTDLAPGTYTPVLRYRLSGVDCFETRPAITISQPTIALTASAGVSELAGCGPAREGKIRITNPQGGTPFAGANPYLFSFDNQATWTTVNDAYKAPGTYTVYVKDANNCIFSAPVIIDPEPAEPEVNVTPKIDFNCDGTATSTVTVANPANASYTYEYYLDNVKNTNVPNNVFLNVPSGSHSIKVEYKLNSVPTFSNLLFEDFGKGGYTTIPGISPLYCFEDETTPHPVTWPALCGKINDYQINDGKYAAASSIKTTFGVWLTAKDHTLPSDPLGRFLCVNIGKSAGIGGILYSKPINDVIPNQPVIISLWAENLIRKSKPNYDDPKLTIQLINDLGLPTEYLVATTPIATPWVVPKSDKWEYNELSLNPGTYNNLSFVIRSYNNAFNGNDVLLDDIKVFQLPKTCISSKTFPLVIDPGKAFTAQITGTKNVTCNGLTNGEFTIVATNFDATKGFEYSKDNGATWSAALFASPVPVSNLAGNLYKVIVRPVGSSVTACAKPFDVNISQPAAVTLSASVTKTATCTTGATITAIGGGGTPTYQYELRQADGVTVKPGYAYSNNGGIFTNVPSGSYTVFVKDANGCQIPVGAGVTVTAPPALTATLANTTDYCYTTANPATLDVTVSGGTGPFTYKLDANAAVSSAATTYSFTNVAPGTHTIVVTDSKNCDDTISSIVIAPQIGLTVSLLNDLTCLVDASIGNPVVSGGNGTPYTYTVSHNGGTATTVTSFPYTATTHGTYVFTVTDSKGCPATSNTITVTAKTTPTISTNKTDITCNNANDGTITVTASGGFTSAYTYEITGPVTASQTTNKFTGLSAGDYDVRVIDSKGCPSLPVRVTIVNPTALVVSASATTFTCSATNTKQAATVTIDVPTTGTSPYKYSFNGGSFTNTNTLVVNDNGTDQTINYAVRDASNCVTPGSIILNKLNPPTIATISNTPIYCLPASSTTSTVTVPVTAGTGVAPLAYTIVSGPVTNTTGATTGIFTGLTSGTYVFRVTDANGCYVTKSHIVPALTPIAVTATKLTDVDCFGNTTGSARFTVSSFSLTGNYAITVSSTPASLPYTLGTTGDVHTLTGLVAGTYTFSVTDNTTGCTDFKSVTITQPTASLDVTIVSNKNANCNVATARVEILAAGGTPNYRYSFVTSATTPGAYGNSPIANLNPTTSTSWYAHVIDAKGCTFILPITIATDPTPTVTATAAGQCLGVGTFTITANNTTPAAGIVTPITYSLNGGAFQSGNTFTVTASGDYIVRIKDGNGCIVPAATITVVPQLTLNAVLNKDITCVLGDEPARITVTPSGGSGLFTYAITTPLSEASNITGATTGIFTTNTAGSYTFTVTDTTTGCTYTTTTAIDVTTPVNPEFLVPGITQTAFINCNGDDTAAIAMAIDNTKGQSPFVFNVLNTTTGINYGTQTSGLSAGDYLVTVTDAKGCIDTETINITEPDPIVIDFDTEDLKCTDDGTGTNTNIVKGKIIINGVTGGSPSYNYYVTGINGYNDERLNITGSAFFDIVDFGLYQIRVVDANGCSALVSNIKIASPPDELVIDVNTSATCAGGSAEVKIGTALASAGPFHFAVYTGAGQTYTPPTTLPWQDEDAPNSKKTTFTGLIPGVTYTFIVFDDATDCYYYQTADTAIPSTTNLAINNFVPNNITCTSANDGNVSFDIFNGNAYSVDVNYQVYEDFTNLLITGVGGTATISAGGTHNVLNLGTLPVGSYYVLVQETSGANAGCSAISAPFNIKKSPVELTITASVIKNANCNDLGIITGQAKEGTGPYTYQVTTSATPPSASDVNWVPGNTFTKAGSLAGITYYVYAKDAYGCIKSDDVILFQDAPPAISVPTPICYNGTAFTINLVTDASATATILPATYKVEPIASLGTAAYQNGSTFTLNAAGTYRLYIKDGNGCEAFVDYVVRPQLQLSPSLTKELDCNLPTPNATVTVTASGGAGAGSYTYTITAGAVGNTTGATTGIFTGLDAGNYTFEVNDGTCTATATFTIDPIPTTVIAAPTVTDVSCNGGNDGTITIDVTSGVGPYEYSLFDGVTATAFTTNNTFTDLVAGTAYVVTVRNGKDCLEATLPITIKEPDPLIATATAAANTTCSTTTVISVNPPTGGTPSTVGTGYTYSFNGLSFTGDNTFTVNNGPLATTTTIVVRDANGCTFNLVNVTTPALTPPTDLSFNVTTAPTCPANSATVQVTATGGLGSLDFDIVEFNNVSTTLYPTQTTAGSGVSASFASLPPGDYIFRVTDENGCTYQESFTVDPVTNITVAASATTNVTCFGAGNGSATFDVANFGGTYNYVFDSAPIVNGVNNAQLTFTALAPGLHTLVVTDAITGCPATANVNISQPAAALDFTATATKINCNNDNATITVLATGGTPTYKYAVLQSPSSAPALTAYGLSNLLTVDTNGGTNMVWDVYVVDANGCPLDKPQTIVLDANPSAISVAPFSECPDPINGTYTFTINTPTGVGPFTYSIGGGFQTSPTFVVNAPGSYDVTVKDANGCPTTVTGLVVIRQPLILTPTVTTPVSCATNDGVVSVNTTGGSGNYEYRIDSGVYPMTTPFTGLASGAHTVYVRDTTTGCEVFADITLQAATEITGFDLETTPVTCYGGFDGTITATMDTPAPGVNDNPIYTYTLTGISITGVTMNVGPQDSPLFNGLEASDVNGYTVVVSSARGCTESKTIVVAQPAQIIVPTITPVQFACTSGNAGNLATITVTGVTGGTTPYLNYEFIKNGSRVQFGSSNVYTEADYAGGTYVVNVYDTNGCPGTSAPITIAPYVQLDKVNVTVTNAITCTNLEDIAVSVTSIGGTPSNLEFIVQDVTYDVATGTIPSYGTNYNATQIVNIPNATFTNLPIGNYLIKVRNLVTNCEIIGVHYVNNPNTFELLVDNVVDVICLNDNNGSARVTLVDRVPTPVNNAGEFTYTLVDALGNALPGGTSTAAGVVDLTNLAVGTYTITATLNQAPSCTVSKNFTITGPNELLQIIETHTEITCVAGNNDGSISATATGGWPGGYEFQLEETSTAVPISPWSTTSTFNGLTAGNYVVKVRDSRGCEVFKTVVLNNPTPITFTATPSTPLLTCKGDTNASISVSAPAGGQGTNYLYTLTTTSATPMISSGPQANPLFTNLGAGTYTVTVTDGWGCGTTSLPIVIAEPTEVVANLVVASTQTCKILSTLTLSATGGTGTYTYSADGSFTVSANPLLYSTFATATTILNVPVGTYRYYVRDANQCISVVSNDIKIEPLPALQVAIDVQNAKINCNGDRSGVIVATATGGLGNYGYTLLDAAGTPVVPLPTQLTPGRFTDLPAGNYQVRVDSDDCNVISTGIVSINEPLLPVTASAVVTPVTCNGAANGIITVTASGGTGIIKYAISPRLDQFFDTGVFDQLAPGTYQIIVQDQNGCYVLLSRDVTEPQPIFVNTVAGSEVQEVCFGDNNAAFDINIIGGVAPYSVSIDNRNGTYTTGTAAQNVFPFTGLTGGDHTVYIKDFNGCTAEWLVALDKSVNLDPKASVDYGCDNNAPSNTVTVTLDPSILNKADVDYALDGAVGFRASNVFVNVAPGFHTITARHSNGCEKITAQFEVKGFAQLTLNLADGGLNEIVATAAGGAGNYQYSFDNGSSFSANNKFIYYKSGDYTVIVRDANGCEATATRFFEFIDIKVPNVFTPNGDGNNDTWLPTNTINYKDLTISIFDRYGRKVASLREGEGWDGKYNSLELPTGDYWYILKLKNVQDDREFVGHFTLMR